RTLLQRTPLDPACAVHIAREVAQALHYAHRRTDTEGRALMLVHGDVTPRNVLLSEEGEVKLADFGIARALPATAPWSHTRGGTPGFTAPEVSSGAIDHRADIYSLGATLYCALGGTISPTIELAALRKHKIPDDLIEIVARATAAAAQDRFLSA